MNYGSIRKTDIANGVGVRVSLFVSGCTHHCKGCFNPETWNFEYGKPFTKETEDEIIAALKPSFVQGLTLLGGEPLEPQNQTVLLPFLEKLKEIYPDKNIWCYTGYTLEKDLLFGAKSRARCEETDALLRHIDVLVDGEFQIDKKDIRLKFRGSSNQRILDLPQSLAAKKAVWVAEFASENE